MFTSANGQELLIERRVVIVFSHPKVWKMWYMYHLFLFLREHDEMLGFARKKGSVGSP